MAADGGVIPPATPLGFVKMHGLGNDFVILDRRQDGPAVTPAAARAVGDRRLGVGFDQLIVITQPEGEEDAGMDIWNPDGSRAGACGNATRCVADLLMRETGRDSTMIRTVAGLLACERAGDLVRVNMGPPRLDWREIPLAAETPTNRIDPALLPLEARNFGAPGAVNMGNPHLVFFVNDAEAVPLAEIGPVLETAPLAPDRANIEFCSVRAPDELRMRVWERGAGITQACGSGACAAAVAGARMGLIERRARVVLDGGVLEIDWRDDGVRMTGPTQTSFHGVFDPALFAS